jgi:hypothetical protein
MGSPVSATDRRDWTPEEHCEHANQHLSATSSRRDVHWVVRNGRTGDEFRVYGG